MDYQYMGQYLNSLGPDFWISVSFSIYGSLKLAKIAILHQVRTAFAQQPIGIETSGWCQWIEHLAFYQKRPTGHVHHVSHDRQVTQNLESFLVSTEFCRFSKSISSAIYWAGSGLMMNYQYVRQYLNSLGPDFWISVSFSIYGSLKLAKIAILHRVRTAFAQQPIGTETSGWCQWIEHLAFDQKRQTGHVHHLSRDSHVTQNLEMFFGEYWILSIFKIYLLRHCRAWSCLMKDYQYIGQYLNSRGPNSWILVSFSIYGSLKVVKIAILHLVRTAIAKQRIGTGSTPSPICDSDEIPISKLSGWLMSIEAPGTENKQMTFSTASAGYQSVW